MVASFRRLVLLLVLATAAWGSTPVTLRVSPSQAACRGDAACCCAPDEA